MKVIKSFFIIALVCILPTTVAFGADKVVLTVWDQANTAKPNEAFETLIATFEEAHPGVKIEREPMGMEDIRAAMKTAIASGEGPDIIGSSIGGYVWNAIDAGLFVDLTEAYMAHGWEERVLPWTKAYTSFRGKYWSVPNEAEIVGIFYHKDIFKEHEIAVPDNWDDFLAACEKLKQAGYDPPITTPGGIFVFNTHFESPAYGAAVPQELLDNAVFEKGSWDRPEFIKALSMIQTLNDKGYWPEDINGIQWADAFAMFFNKTSAMALNGSWLLPSIEEQRQEQPDLDVGFFPFPPLPGIESRVVKNAGSGWLISSASEHPEEAIAFLDFIISKEAEKTWVEVAHWFPPVKLDTSNISMTTLEAEIWPLINSPVAAYSMFNILPQDVNQATWTTMQKMYMGKATPEDVMKAKQEQWQIAIEEGRVPEK